MNRNTSYTFGFSETDKTTPGLVGGKGANLGELSRMNGITVPAGFCVTTDAYKTITANNPELSRGMDELKPLKASDRKAISALSASIRRIIEATPIPEALRDDVTQYLKKIGEAQAFAVRSSATAEDLPSASFAGQQDSYLNIIGIEAVLNHIRKCWASLFTERAVTYRIQNGFDHHQVQLAVVVQQMIFPQASGILFTADPVTSNRNIISIDASFGLGEALVSGRVNADNYKIRGGAIIEKKIAAKQLAIYGLKGGGTQEQALAPGLQNKQALSDAKMLQLAQQGRAIEAHFGQPQDIEWCLADDVFYIVQSRPITTLFPIPAAPDQENHVYVSVGHQQMMTDAMKPLGLSFFLMLTRAPMRSAGGRLFVDISKMLASPAGRTQLNNTLGKSDPLIRDALNTIMERTDFIKQRHDQ